VLFEKCKIYENLYGIYCSNITFFSSSANNSLTQTKKEKQSNINEISESFLMFKNCEIYQNLDIGIFLNYISLTKIFFINCKIWRNNNYGIYLTNNNLDSINIPLSNNNVISNISNFSTVHSKKSAKENITSNVSNNTKNDIPVVNMKNCDIFNNKFGGIFLKNFLINLDLCKLYDNSCFAVEIPLEKNKSFIKLLNYDNSELNIFITNPIGGSWGKINNKKTICGKNENCFIL
jgi:hypothetical protein